MESREKILDTEGFYLSPVHPGELSQSSEILSLPSANKLADLSLASDLSDSEVENEATVQTSSACGDHQDNSNDMHYEDNSKIPPKNLMKSSMLPYSQRQVDSTKKDSNVTERQSEAHLIITKEVIGHDESISNGKSSKSFYSPINVIEGEGITDIPTVSLDDVRAALQQNCNLLSDRHLLNDLLKSLDDKIEQEFVAEVSTQPHCSGKKQNITLYQKNTMDNILEENNNRQLSVHLSGMSSVKDLSKNFLCNTDSYQEYNSIGGIGSFVTPVVDPFDDPRTSRKLQEDLPTAFFNSSAVEQDNPQKYPSTVATHPSYPRHVKFQSAATTTQAPLMQIENRKCGDKEELQCSTQRSLKVLKNLAGLRWGLMGWEDVSNSPPTDSNSSLTFLHQLLSSFQGLQLENKHLKEELTATLKKCRDLSEESNTKQQMYEKREARLIEADKQLGELQQAWAAAQEAGHQELTKLRSHCHNLKQENTFLKKEAQCLKNDLTELKAMTQQHTLMKAQMLETEELLAASKKKMAEILEENNRLNLCVEENKNYSKELKEVKVPQLLGQLEDVKAMAGKMDESNKQLFQSKAKLEKELHILQEEHKLLVEKIVEEQERKEETEQKKTVLEDKVKNLSEKVAVMKTQLHLHYQAQVEDLVVKKSAALQEQLETLELNLQKTFDEQFSAQVKSHEVACKKLQERSEEEIQEIKSFYEKQLEKLHCEMRQLGLENLRLQQQRQGVISAVSSILGVEDQVPFFPKEKGYTNSKFTYHQPHLYNIDKFSPLTTISVYNSPSAFGVFRLCQTSSCSTIPERT